MFCFNVEVDFAEHVLGPVYKSNGKYTMTDYCGLIKNEYYMGEICFMEAAINVTTRSGLFFFQFDNGILEEEVLDLFENCGGCHVDVMSFPTEADAVEALKFVIHTQRQGCYSFVCGECPQTLLSLMVNETTLETLNQEKRILKMEVDKLLFLALHAEEKPSVSADEPEPLRAPLSLDELTRENAMLKAQNDALSRENANLKERLHDFTADEPAAKRARDA